MALTLPPSPTSTAHSSLSGGHSGSSQSPSPIPPPTPISPTQANGLQSQQTTPTPGITSGSMPAPQASGNASNGPEKRKPSRRANTAERRATHNAVERQRRETLNGRFMDLASLLPNLASVRRPSKSAIVNSSIALIHQQRRQRFIAARELRGLYSQFLALKSECEEWRMRASMASGGMGGMGMGRIEEGERSRDFVELLGMQIPDNLDEISDEERSALRAVEGPGGMMGEDDDDMDGDYSHGYSTGLGAVEEKHQQQEERMREQMEREQQAQAQAQAQREQMQREQQAREMEQRQAQAQAQAQAQQQVQQRVRSSTFSGATRSVQQPTTPTYDVLGHMGHFHHPHAHGHGGHAQGGGHHSLPHSPADLFPVSVPSHSHSHSHSHHTSIPPLPTIPGSVGEVYSSLAETYAGIFGSAPHQGPPAPGAFVNAQQAFALAQAQAQAQAQVQQGQQLEVMLREFEPKRETSSSSSVIGGESPIATSAISSGSVDRDGSAHGSPSASTSTSASASTASLTLSSGSSSGSLELTSPVEEEAKYALGRREGEGVTLNMPMYGHQHQHQHSHGGFGVGLAHGYSMGHGMMASGHGHSMATPLGHAHAHAHGQWKSVSPVGSVNGGGIFY